MILTGTVKAIAIHEGDMSDGSDKLPMGLIASEPVTEPDPDTPPENKRKRLDPYGIVVVGFQTGSDVIGFTQDMVRLRVDEAQARGYRIGQEIEFEMRIEAAVKAGE